MAGWGAPRARTRVGIGVRLPALDHPPKRSSEPYSNLPESGLSSPVVAACAGIAAEMVPNLRRLTSEETLTHGPLAAKAGSEKIGSDSNILVAHDASSMGVKHGEEYILLKQQMNLTLTTAPAHACGACGQKTPWGDSSSSSLKAPVATRSTPGKK